ncbi:MAG TPA: thioredoxin family protein [Terriglobales bacterium]|nr:thioredoxin family protein [Terriglobales bacterium]
MRLAAVSLLLAAIAATAQSSPAAFPGVQQWSTALNSTDPAALHGLYSSNPPAQLIGADHKPEDIAGEFSFWQQLKTEGVRNVETSLSESQDKNGLHIVYLITKFQMHTPAGERTRYVLEQQGWQQQAGAWRIVVAAHSDVIKMPQPPSLNPNLYPPNVDAKAEIKEAVAHASREHKRILLIFGGNWCYDCHVLDYALHETDAAPIAKRSFIIVHVDIGEGKLNPDLVSKYQIPLQRGVPALAVLDSDGKLLYSAHGEFEKARSMDPDDIIAFLKKWQP